MNGGVRRNRPASVDPLPSPGATAVKRRKRKKTSKGARPVSCPFCGEPEEIYVDLGGGRSQTYTEDCPVCCRPRLVHVEPGADDDDVIVWLERSD